ncbi:MAG: cardiolipin synthase [Prevotellaceae bacterium]|jgi:cardiolipin synthase|nr:cardiolipin synthase [Prevotellaceae bacterium]
MKKKGRRLLCIALLAAASPIAAQHTASSDSAVIGFLASRHIPVTVHNTLTLLKSGSEKFDRLFADIKKAKRHIHLEYFNFRNDSIGNLLFDLLADKAQEGVEVRAIFDGFGNLSNNKPLHKDYLQKLRERGIDIVAFDPIRFPYLNHIAHRDHRKIVVIDAAIAYMGGMNVADYYIDGLPEIGDWRDMHLRIEGEAVNELQQIFLAMWNKVTEQTLGGDMYFNHSFHTGDSMLVAIVERTPRTMPRQLRETIVQSIRAAQKKIQIVNPYFIPDKPIRRALNDAVKRGITVELMIPAKSDIPFTPDGMFHVAHRLMKKGADVYVYNNGFHHSKVMTVDDKFCTVGSLNFDYRSLRYDYEVNAFIFDAPTALALGGVFEADKAHSTKMDAHTWKKRSCWRRFVGTIANLMAPLM